MWGHGDRQVNLDLPGLMTLSKTVWTWSLRVGDPKREGRQL